jgi:hypothetical protein
MPDAQISARATPGFTGKLIDVGLGGTPAFTVDTAGNVVASGTLTATGATATVGGVILPDTEFVTYIQPVGTAAATWAVSTPFFTFPNDGRTYKCTAASVRYTTASSSGVVTVELAASGTAVGAGTNQFTGALTSAAANTVVNMTAPVYTTSAAGGSLNAIWSGTVTGLVGCVITVAIQRVS